MEHENEGAMRARLVRGVGERIEGQRPKISSLLLEKRLFPALSSVSKPQGCLGLFRGGAIIKG